MNDERLTVPAIETWVMLVPNPDNGKKAALYSVSARDEDEARRNIEQQLTPKKHRQAILQAWIKAGRPVRPMKPRR
jgi:hypothetical protein